jgi:hypothetical protein
MIVNKCYSCDNNMGPESLQIVHKGEITGFICDICLQNPTIKGMKMLLKKDEKGLYRLEQVTPLENPV